MTDAHDGKEPASQPFDPDPRTAPDDGATDGGISAPQPAEGGDDVPAGDDGSPED